MGRRTPERAAAVLDRAARMSQFKPGWFDQRLGDRQMRTPGKVDSPFRIERLPQGVLKRAEIADIPLKSVVTEQPTVSVKNVKAKLATAGDGSRTPPVIRHGGQYYLADGNHETTGMRALGMKSGKFQVYDLNADIKPPLVSPQAIRTAGRVTQMVGAHLAVGGMAALAYQNRLASGGSTGEAIVDGAVAGGRTAATGAVMGGLIKGAKAVPALRGAASFASRALLPLSIAGHAAGYAYGAWKRGEGAGGIAMAAGWGAINGVVPIDLVREAVSGGEPHEAQQFAKANRDYQAAGRTAKQNPDAGNDGKRRGWSNAARISAAQSRGAQVLPYGGNPDSGPETGRAMQE